MTQGRFDFGGNDYHSGEWFRDEGIRRVTENGSVAWHRHFSDALAALRGLEVTAEDIRPLCGDPPNHPNAFGAAMHGAVRAGVLLDTGRTVAARRPEAHVRGGGLKVYRVT